MNKAEKIENAIILAAGLGKRMRPLTNKLPKPLIEVNGRTLLDRNIDTLKEYGIKNIVVNMSYLAQLIEKHLHGTDIKLSFEEEPLETGGGIYNSLKLLGDKPFFALNSDSLYISGKKHILEIMQEFWDSNNIDILLLLHNRDAAKGFGGSGDFFIGRHEDMKTRSHEYGTPIRRGNNEFAPYVFTGTQILKPQVFNEIDTSSKIFSMNIVYNHYLKNHPERIKAITADGVWLHVGDIEGLKEAEKFLTHEAYI